MKKIFLDENMRNANLVRKLRKLGYKLVFTPQGVSDYDLEDWLVTRDDIVMVTKDIEFDLKFVEYQKFILQSSHSQILITLLWMRSEFVLV